METEQRVSILHLEDSPEDRELIQMALAHKGVVHHVNGVSSEAAFLRALEQGTFDVILSDSNVPGFDGKAALVLARKRCPDTPFIFVSGYSDARSSKALKEAGADDYVSKEQLEVLADALLRALRAKRKEEQRHPQ